MENPEPGGTSSAGTSVAAERSCPTEEAKQARSVQTNFKALFDLRSLVWPVAIAMAVGLLHYVGRAAMHGKVSALGIYHLAEPMIAQDYVFVGVVVVAQLALLVGLIFTVGAALFLSAAWLSRFMSTGFQTSLQGFRQSRALSFVQFVLALATMIAMSGMANDLVREVDSIVLKPSMEVGTAWMRISMDQEQDWATAYELLLSGGLTVFLYLSARILTADSTRLSLKVLYGSWAGIQALSFVFSFASIWGATTTIEPFPIVAFSGVEQLLGKHVLPVLIGSDDKLFAFLVVNVGAPSDNPMPKTILYLPRSEVKWITIIRRVPLHLLSHSQELKSLVLSGHP